MFWIFYGLDKIYKKKIELEINYIFVFLSGMYLLIFLKSLFRYFGGFWLNGF